MDAVPCIGGTPVLTFLSALARSRFSVLTSFLVLLCPCAITLPQSEVHSTLQLVDTTQQQQGRNPAFLPAMRLSCSPTCFGPYFTSFTSFTCTLSLCNCNCPTAVGGAFDAEAAGGHHPLHRRRHHQLAAGLMEGRGRIQQAGIGGMSQHDGETKGYRQEIHQTWS